MSKKRRLRAEVSERRLVWTLAQKNDQHKGTLPTDKVATTRGLLKTFRASVQFLLAFILVFLLFIRLMSWLSVFEWSKSRCHLLNPSSLKMADLKSLLEERGLDASQLSRQDLETAIWGTGGVMEIEMEPFSEVGNNSQRDAVRFETWGEFWKSVPLYTTGVYLVLSSADLERSASELIRWRQFLHRLSKHRVKFVFVGCDDDGDCFTPKVTLRSIWILEGFMHWNASSYVGPMRPSDIFQWITKALSENVLRANSANDVFRHPDRLTHAIVAHSTHPLPLSYAVLASELRGRVSFFWVETLDEYLPDRTSLIVLDPDSYDVYHCDHFLNQEEIRWLVKLIAMDRDDRCELLSWFFVLFAVSISLVAGGSFRHMVKAMLWNLLLCVLSIVLFALWEVCHPNVTIEAIQYPAAMFAALIKYFRPELQLFFHLFSQYFLMRWICPVYSVMGLLVYVLMADFSARIRQFFPTSKNSVSPKPGSVKTVPTATSTLMVLKVVKAAVKINSSITKAIINVPLDAARTIARISFNIAMATINVPFDAVKTIAKNAYSIIKANIQMPQDTDKTVITMHCGVTVPRGGADGRKGYETNVPSAPNQRLKSVTQSQSLQRQRSSRSANTRQRFPSVSNGTIRDYPNIHPFEYPPLMNSVNRDLDKTATEQMVRRQIPKVSHQPIISDKELRLSMALQKSEAHYPWSFLLASRTVPRCHYCKTDFQPTSEVRVLACREIFHPGCLDMWMKEGNIDCPICQYYATDRMFLS